MGISVGCSRGLSRSEGTRLQFDVSGRPRKWKMGGKSLVFLLLHLPKFPSSPQPSVEQEGGRLEIKEGVYLIRSSNIFSGRSGRGELVGLGVQKGFLVESCLSFA